MEQELRDRLFETAAKLKALADISEQTIGQKAINDNTFFKRARDGAGFTVKTYDRLMAWMEDNMPKPARKAGRRPDHEVAA